MSAFVALLRAVNVGGTGKLPMVELKVMATELGYRNVATYIASGNLVFEADGSEAEVKAALERVLAAYAGKPVGVLVRTAAEMAAAAVSNPFKDIPGNRIAVIFLDSEPPKDTLAGLRHLTEETVILGKREIYIHYPQGMGQSRLIVPAAKSGTARNMNTVETLARMAATL